MQARDALALAAAFDWSAVVVALITLSGVIFNACLGALVLWHIRTPSGTRIGTQVEDVNHVSRVTHHRVEALAKRVHAVDGEDEG